MTEGLLAGAGWFLFLVFGQIAASRILRPAIRPRFTQFLMLAGLVLVPPLGYLLQSVSTEADRTMEAWIAGSICGELMLTGLFVLYMPFYYTVAASLSVRSLILLARQPGESLPIFRLREHFASRDLVGQRLETMVHNRFLGRTSYGYSLAPKGLLVAAVFAGFKRLWRLGSGG